MSSENSVGQTQALASLYKERLQGTQIRLLQILPSEVCEDCGYFHSDDDSDNSDSNCEDGCECDREYCGCKREDDKTGEEARSATSEGSSIQHKPCRDRGCNGCDLINIRIITVRLEDMVGKFDALSYVWGWADVKEDVRVNGTRVYVTMNLELALRRLRNTEKVGLLWVDALCINQTDIEERNEQVMRMKDIYSLSRKVFVWIGEEILDVADEGKRVEDARIAIKLLKDIYQVAKDNDMRTSLDTNLFIKEPPRFEKPEKLGLPKTDAPEWECLKDYLRRPWFSRVWVIQEVAVAREAVVILGDDIKMPWVELAVAATWLLWRGFSDHISGLNKVWNILIIDACRKHITVPLLRRLSPTGTFQSTLHHDKIYALLGTTFEGKRIERYPRLRIDYGRDWRELFREVVRHCIETRGIFGKRRTLHVLSQVEHELNDDGSFAWDKEQSSWVPGWDEHHTSCPLAWRDPVTHFNTTKDTDAVMSDSGDGRILSLKGVLVDKIAKTYTNIPDVEDHDNLGFSLEEFSAVAKLWSSVALNWRVAYHNRYPHLADAFSRTITTGSINKYGDSKATTGAYFAAYYETGLLFAEDEPGFKLPFVGAPEQKDVEVFDENIPNLPESERYEATAHMMNNFRTEIEQDKVFFVTKKGYMGIGPEIMAVDDDVCVLLGGVTPFLVRRVKKGVDCPEWLDLAEEKEGTVGEKLNAVVKNWLPSRKSIGKDGGKGKVAREEVASGAAKSLPKTDVFRLVGECYVTGLMDGEALDAKDKGELTEKLIHLV